MELNSKQKNCPECGKKYIYFDLHWLRCEKNPERQADLIDYSGGNQG